MDIKKINKYQYTKKEFLKLLEDYDYHNREIMDMKLGKIKGTLIDSLLDLVMFLDIKLDIKTVFHISKDKYDTINNIEILKKITKVIPDNTRLLFDNNYSLKTIVVNNTKNTIRIKFK